MNKFKNKDGQVSRYGFLCGYIQQKENDQKVVELFLDGASYYVKALDFKADSVRLCWEVFETDQLGKARKFYQQMVKQFLG